MRYATILALVLTLFAISDVAAQSGYSIYHEAWCPSVDHARMTRMTRHNAEATGVLPAPDCHPETPVRYLGELSLPEISAPSHSEKVRDQPVTGYTTRDGRTVGSYMRSAPDRH
jgi:hypothetical protein